MAAGIIAPRRFWFVFSLSKLGYSLSCDRLCCSFGVRLGCNSSSIPSDGVIICARMAGSVYVPIILLPCFLECKLSTSTNQALCSLFDSRSTTFDELDVALFDSWSGRSASERAHF